MDDPDELLTAYDGPTKIIESRDAWNLSSADGCLFWRARHFGLTAYSAAETATRSLARARLHRLAREGTGC